MARLLFKVRMMDSRKIAAVIVLVLLTSSCASLLMPKVENNVTALRAGQYKLDREHATLLFKVQHLGLSTYVGRFNDFDASLDFEPDDIASSKLDAVVRIQSLDINNQALAQDLLSATWFDASRYPEAVFTTQSVKPINESEFEFVGELTWRGISKEVSVNGIFHGGASNILTGKYTLGFSATMSILRSDFGMDAYIPIVGDQIDLEVYLEFQKT